MLNKKTSIFIALALLFVIGLNSVSAQVVTRPDLRYCGSTSRSGSNLFLGTGPYNEIMNSCQPDANTQALFVSRSGSTTGNGPAWLAYLNAGGVIITEYRISDNVYNEIFGTAYPQGSSNGDCSDNAMPAVKLNPGDPFWTSNAGLTETASNTEGCGMDLNAIVNGEGGLVTALGGWFNTQNIMFARRQQGTGVLWMVEADWQDNELSNTDNSRNFMGVLINAGTGQGPLLPAMSIPSLGLIGMLLMVIGFVWFSRQWFVRR